MQSLQFAFVVYPISHFFSATEGIEIHLNYSLATGFEGIHKLGEKVSGSLSGSHNGPTRNVSSSEPLTNVFVCLEYNVLLTQVFEHKSRNKHHSSRQPVRPFRNLRTQRSGDRQILRLKERCTTDLEISEIVKGSIGRSGYLAVVFSR